MCNRAEDPPVLLLYLISQTVKYMTTDCKGPPASASVSVVYYTHPIALYLSHPTVLLTSRYTGQIRLLTLALNQSDQTVNPSVKPVRSDC